MKVLETRVRKDGLKYRRLEDGTWTVEMPLTVMRALGTAKVREAMATFQRGAAMRERAAKLRAEVAAREGWKATAVAHDLGTTEARVRQIRRSMMGSSNQGDSV